MNLLVFDCREIAWHISPLIRFSTVDSISVKSYSSYFEYLNHDIHCINLLYFENFNSCFSMRLIYISNIFRV